LLVLRLGVIVIKRRYVVTEKNILHKSEKFMATWNSQRGCYNKRQVQALPYSIIYIA